MASFHRHLAALVHPRARVDEVERAQHAQFIALRLAVALPLLALAPLYLFVRGAPTGPEALVFSFLLAPLGAVLLLQRTGRLDWAQALCAAAATLLGATLAAKDGGLTAGAAACFLVAPLEAALGGSAALALGVSAFSLLALAALFGLCPASGPAAPADYGMVAALAIYGALLALANIAAGRLRARLARASAEAYGELTETIAEIVLRLDGAGVVAEVAAPPANTLGCARADLVGRGLFERVLVSDRPGFLKALGEAARSDAPCAVEFRLRLGGLELAPQFRWAELRAHRSRGGAGGVIGVLRDAGPAVEAREAIAAAREASDQASLWKDRFLANVSHELRTPLNAIIGFSEMLANPALAPVDPARQREYAEMIHRSGRHLLSLVNSILDMSKIETGNFEIDPEPFELGGLVDFCCDLMKLQASEKRVALTRAMAPKIGELVADKRACKQILLNLLSNAVKFTPAGGAVAVSVRPDGAHVEIAVSDTGIGVSPKDLARLGDPFFQAKASYDRPYEGAGLGLSIVRGLVALHGGAIKFESAPNEGAIVTVRLPLDGPRAAKDAAQATKIEVLTRRAQAPCELPPSHDQVKKIA